MNNKIMIIVEKFDHFALPNNLARISIFEKFHKRFKCISFNFLLFKLLLKII